MLTTTEHIVSDVFEDEFVFCCLLDGHIFYSYNKPGTICDDSVMKSIFSHYEKLSTERPLKIIAEMGLHSSMSRQAREFLQEHTKLAVCEAAVIHSLAQRMLINFYHSFKKHQHPSKVFKSSENALSWVKTFQEVEIHNSH